MAQKGMFDKTIVNSEEFMKLPSSSIGLYFLLNMKSDSYGLVRPERILINYAGMSDYDLKILEHKERIISFPSGVVAITDWHKNNWFDKRRFKPTEFYQELRLLTLENGRYTRLSDGLAELREKSALSAGLAGENAINFWLSGGLATKNKDILPLSDSLANGLAEENTNSLSGGEAVCLVIVVEAEQKAVFEKYKPKIIREEIPVGSRIL